MTAARVCVWDSHCWHRNDADGVFHSLTMVTILFEVSDVCERHSAPFLACEIVTGTGRMR
jgi:hypothetical protein